MDLQPLLVLLGSLDRPVHGITHTWQGALIIAFLVFGLWASSRRLPGTLFSEIRHMPPAVVAVLAFSALLGTVTHLMLDACMHADVCVAPLSTMPAIPNTDRLAEFIPFSELVAIYAAMVSPLFWLGRRAL